MTTPTRPTSTDETSPDLHTRDMEVEFATRIEAGLYAQHVLDMQGASYASREELEWVSRDGAAARSEFIESNLPLAISIARRYTSRGWSEPDIVQDAYLGLIRAVDKFDHTKGFRFSTYATWWITAYIKTGLRESEAVIQPEHLWRHIVKTRAVNAATVEATGRKATVAEIMERGGLNEREVERSLRADRRFVSFEAVMDAGGDAPSVLGAPHVDDSIATVEHRVAASQLSCLIGGALSALPNQSRQVLELRYGVGRKKPMTVTDVATLLGVSRSTVRNREVHALSQLRAGWVDDRELVDLLP